MRAALRQVLFRSATGLDLNFAGGVFSLNNTRTASPAAIPGWSFSRTDTNGIATALDLAGNVIQFATGVPRITNRGILVEEARTNLAPWSENASSGMSFNGGATFTANTGTSPAGTTTADTLALTSLGYAYAPTAAGQAIGTYTGSLWLRADAPTTVAIRLTRAALGANQTVQTASVTTSWQRFSVSLLTTGVDTIQFGLDQRVIVGGPGTDATVQIWGLQVELGAFATSPIITTGAAGTRGADNARQLFTPGASGTFLMEYEEPAVVQSSSPRILGADTLDAGPLTLNSGSRTAASTWNGAANLVATGTTRTAGTAYKFALSWDATGRRFVIPGATASDANGIGALTQLVFGSNNGLTAGGTLGGYIKRLQAFPNASTTAQMQTLVA
jgi:hypothetical protein